jgi:HlyD family secretion protein
VQVKVKVLNPDAYLRPEMNASVAFYASEKPDGNQPESRPVVTVPASAIRDNSVFVVLDGKAVRRSVKVAGTTAQGMQVTQGLIGGEDIVANPPADLKDGQKVRPKQA